MKRLVTEGAAAEAADVPAEISARDRVRNRRNARKRRKTMKTVAISLSVVVGLIAVYAVGFSYFKAHYYPGTQVAGIDAAGMTADELTHALDERIASYEATVGDGSFELTFTGADVDLACDTAAFAQRLMTCQDASSWPAGIVGANARSETETGITFDEQKLSALVEPAITTYNESARLPVAATLVLNGTKNAFVVKDEQDGTALDAETVLATVKGALARGEQSIELGQSDLIQPAYRAGDQATLDALARANAALDLDIPLVHAGEKISHILGATFAPWLTAQDDLKLAVDQKAVSTWAEEGLLWLDADYADDANVYSLDLAALATALQGAIQAGTNDPIELPYTTTPRYLPGGGSLNPTAWKSEVGRYIDVDKKSQTACLYDATGRVLWETPVTTGNEAGGSGTPVGQFCMYDKQTDFMLIGLDGDNDGNPDYEKHVDFWMPFTGTIGLHDAYWRSVYGGEEYLENGSGGCVNLPHDAAAALYAMAHVNEVVIVHE